MTTPSQYSYGQPAVPARPSGMTTVGKVLFFVGLALSVIAVVVGIWGINRAIQDVRAMQDDAVAVQDSATVAMDADDFRLILAPEGTNPSCTVTGPGGDPVPVTQDATMEQAASQEGVTVVGVFTAVEAGEHTVACDQPAELSPALGFSDAVGFGAAGLAFLALFPLGFLTLLGLVLWLVGRNKDKKAALGPGGSGYSTSSGYGVNDHGYGYGNQGYTAPGQGYPDQGHGGSGQQYGGAGQPYGEGGTGGQSYGGQGYGTPPPPGPGSGSPYGAPPPPGQRDDRGEGGPDDDRGTEQR